MSQSLTLDPSTLAFLRSLKSDDLISFFLNVIITTPEILGRVEKSAKRFEYEMTRKYHHQTNNSPHRLQVLLNGNVIDAVSSFAVSQPKNICILDEVVTSSREYHKGEASGWDDFLENMNSDMWDKMEAQSKASLQYISKKRIPLKKNSLMKRTGTWNIVQELRPIERGCFANIRLEKVTEVDVSSTNVKDADLADLGRACPNMQKLNMNACHNITDIGFTGFSRHCQGLKDIDFRSCRGRITNEGLIEFSRNCRGLHNLDLSNCKRIAAGGVEGLAQHCHELQSIKIGGYGNDRSICTDADLLALSINCQQLQEIHLDGCSEITDYGLIEMSKHLNSQQLHHIVITQCDQISDRGLKGFFKNCTQIKNIRIGGKNLTDDCIIEVSKNCSGLGLEDIHIWWHDWSTDRSLNAFAQNCHGLKKINIMKCPNITEASFINLTEKCSGMESISIGENNWVTDESMNAIAKNCSGLKSLNICKSRNITEASFIRLIESCNGLEYFDIGHNYWVTDRSMNAIAKNCHGLKNIKVYNCFNFSETSFVNLIGNCSDLENISIFSDAWVTDKSMSAIAKNCRGLKV